MPAIIVLIILVPICIVLVFGIMIGVMFLVALMTGWTSLAGKYRKQDGFVDETWSWQSGRIGMGNYWKALRIGASSENLFLGANIFYKPAHKDLLIPLSDITGKAVGKKVHLSCKEAPAVDIKIPKKLADRIQAASKGNWQYQLG
ncbi:MAG: hypothetical protein GY754_09695 [bacterium]|nr:hypothetical protein [bacterium]